MNLNVTGDIGDLEALFAESFKCKCPEPDPPGWMHRSPIECAPLAPGETLQEWRGRRFDGEFSVPRGLQVWHDQMQRDGWAVVGRESVVAEVAELPEGSSDYRWGGHAWDRIVLGFEDQPYG